MTAKTTAIFEKTAGGCYMTLDGTRLDFDQDVSVQITSGGNVVALNIEGSIYHVQLTASITVNGAAFTGTAAQLRDQLAAEVFGSGVASVATYADLTASAASGLFKVTTDETNGGEATYYLKDGNSISWLPTQSV